MNAIEKKETKKIIISKARELFAQHGFNGTSVRTIAEQCDVNIAAINYHFGSKENLYWAVVEESFLWLDGGIGRLVENVKSIDELVDEIFRFMSGGQAFVVSTMKCFLSDMVPEPNSDSTFAKTISESCNYAPPGGGSVIEFLKRENPNISQQDAEWWVSCVLSSIFHFATITSTSMYINFKQECMPKAVIVSNLQRMARSLFENLNK